MRVVVRYFAILRERLKLEVETIDLPSNASVEDAFEVLATSHPFLRTVRRHVQIAVNQEVAASSRPLADGDEIALIPPVAGGSGRPRLFRVVDRPLSVDETLEAVRAPGQGGIALFVGAVRDESQGRRVVRLDYEAYVEMAERTLTKIGEELGKKHGARLAIVHRVGSLAVGDLAVVIAAAAPHRAEAFAACREAIERLKVETPIWKKEFDEKGGTWVGMGP